MDRDSCRRAAVAFAVVVLLMAFWAEPAAAQCAMCRRALQSPEGQRMVAAFRSGILVLLAAPFSLVGVIAALVVRMQRRRLRSEQL
jgi:hypothetical protein